MGAPLEAERAESGLEWGIQRTSPQAELLILTPLTDVITPVKREIIAEGAHARGAYIRQRITEWKEKHPTELACYAQVGDFALESDPPLETIIRLKSAADEPDSHRYAEPQGIKPLRESIASFLNRRAIYPYPVDPDSVVVTPGSKMAGLMTGIALVGQDTKVAVTELVYPGHAAAVRLNGGKLTAFRVNPENGYRVDQQQIAETLERDRPDIIWLSNPDNPRGGVWRVAEARPIVEYMKVNPNVLLVQDIIYSDLVLDDQIRDMVMFSAIPSISSRVVTNHGMSKGQRLTGWRLGFVVAPPGQERLRKNLIAQANAWYAGAPTILQKAAVEAFSPTADDFIENHRRELVAKKNAVMEAMRLIPGIQTNDPEGAFYALMNVTGTGMIAEQFAGFALDQGVGILPTSVFGADILDMHGQPLLRPEIADSTVRWSFAGNLDAQLAGLSRLYHALTEKD